MRVSAMLWPRTAGSMLTGILVGSGYWILIDGYTSCSKNGTDCTLSSSSAGYAWLPPFGATLALIMVNGMKWTELRDDVTGDSKTAAKARLFLLFALLILVISLGGSAFVMERFLRQDGAYTWSGVSCFVSTMLIVAGTFIMRLFSLPPSEAY